MRRSSWPRWFLGLAFSLVAVRADAVVDVTTCNQLVPRNETGVLQADLVCDSQYGVHLDTGATLDLQNHTLTFNFNPAWLTSAAVYCARAVDLRHSRCRVIGAPGGTGAVVGTARFGIFGDKVEVENVSVSGFHDYAIYGDKRAIVRDTAVTNCDGTAIVSDKKVVAERVSASNSGAGIGAGKILGAEVSVNDNTGGGLGAVKLIRLDGLAASGNAVAVRSERLRLENSTLSGNGIDIATIGKPRLELTTCETSRKIDAGAITSETWGVCSAD